MIEEAKKQSNGTSIDLGGEKRSTKELELFATKRNLNLELTDVVIDKSEKYEVVNVISNFQPKGSEIKGVTKNKGFLLSIIGAGFMIIFLLLLKVNTFLGNYKK
jgi:hypothetical protein